MHHKNFLVFIYLFLFTSSGFSQIVNIESSRMDEKKEGWQGLIDLNFYAVENSTSFLQLNNKIKIQHVKKRHIWLFLSDLNLSISNDRSFERNAFQHVRYGYHLDSNWTFESFTQNQYDKIQLINQRFLIGSGIRFQFIEKGLLNASYGFSYMLEYEDALTDEGKSTTSRISNYLNLKLQLKEWMAFYNTTYYQPKLQFFSDYRLSTISVLQFKVTDSLSLTTKLSITYDSTPVVDPSIRKRYSKLTTGFSYKI